MQNHTTGNYTIVLNNTKIAQSMSPAISTNEMLSSNDINQMETSLINMIENQTNVDLYNNNSMSSSPSQQQQQQLNGYATINNLLNGQQQQQLQQLQQQNQYKNNILQPSPQTVQSQSPTSVNKKYINQIIANTTPTTSINKKSLTTISQYTQQQQQQQSQQYINIVQTTPGQIQNTVKLINTSPNQTPQRIIIQPSQQQQQQQPQTIIYSSSPTTQTTTQNQIQIVSQSPQQSQQQQQQQQPQIAFININNRMVPIQTLNIQQKTNQQSNSPQQVKFVIPASTNNTINNNNTTTTNTNDQHQQFIINNDSNRILLTTTGQQQQQQQQQQQKHQPQQTYYVVQSSQLQHLNSNNINQQQQQQQTPKISVVLTGTNNTDNQDSQNANNLAAQITEKMKTLEQIQIQLRQFQVKITSTLNDLKRDLTNLTQQQQIQLALNQTEQVTLHKLVQRRKEVQNEIQQLQQKLLAPSEVTTLQQTQSQDTVIVANNTNKQEVYENIVNRINSMKAKGDMTLDELEQLKKLIEFKHSFETKFNIQPVVLNGVQNENKQQQNTLNSILNRNIIEDPNIFSNFTNSATTTTTTNANTNNALPIINIKIQNPNILQNTTTNTLNQNKIITIGSVVNGNIVTNPSLSTSINNTISTTIGKNQKNILLAQSGSPTQQTKQLSSSIKIRNVPICTIGSSNNITTSSSSSTTPVISLTPNTIKAKPIRTIIASKDYLNGTLSSPSVTSNSTNNTPLFTLLNYDLLMQNGVFNKTVANDSAIKLVKQLDDKLVALNSAEKQQAFLKNQVNLVKKYLEQFTPTKVTSLKNKIHEQLQKDQDQVVNPDYKTPFTDRGDAIKRLSRYHLFQKTSYIPTNEECDKFDECFEKVSERYLKTADAMKKRFHLLQLRTMQRNVPATEESLLLKLFVDDAKLDFEEEKKHKNEFEDVDTLKRKLLKIEHSLAYNENNEKTKIPLSPPPKRHESNLLNRFKYEIDNYTDVNNIVKKDRSLQQIQNNSTSECSNSNNNSDLKEHIKLKIKLIKNEKPSIDDFLNVNKPTNATSSTPSKDLKLNGNLIKNELFDVDNINDDHDHVVEEDDNDDDDETYDESLSELNTSNYSMNENNKSNNLISATATTTTTTNLNYFDNTSDYNIDNLSCMDDFMMNEDELAVQSILDY